MSSQSDDNRRKVELLEARVRQLEQDLSGTINALEKLVEVVGTNVNNINILGAAEVD